MRVPHLNEFLKRAIKKRIIDQILIDFSTSSAPYCNNKVVRVEVMGGSQVSFIAEKGRSWGWGLESDSVELLRIKRSQGIRGKRIILCLGRRCNFRGTLK